MESRHGHLPAGPSLDITFMLSSRDNAPPFTGMRMGRYSLKGDTLFFEAAVPVHMTQSEQAPHYVAQVMLSMVENAKEYFDEFKIDFDIASWQRVVHNLTALEDNKSLTH